jgi:hypothetical protein
MKKSSEPDQPRLSHVWHSDDCSFNSAFSDRSAGSRIWKIPLSSLARDHRSLVMVDHLDLRDSKTGELVMEYPQPGVEGRAARCNATAAIN